MLTPHTPPARLLRLFVALAASSCLFPAYGQPYLYSAGNSASYYDSSLPGYGIAQGSLMVLFGWQLGPAQLLQQSGFPLPNDLGGTSIKVTINGVTRNAPIAYTSAGQVAALLPSSVPAGAGKLTLTYKGQTSYPLDITVVPSAMGIYSMTSSGLGAGVFTTPTYQIKTLADSFQSGDTVVLWGTGLGAVPGDDTAGPLPGAQFPNTEVYVGSLRASVSYAGRSGCCAGLDQINFVIPPGVQGCFVPVAVRNGGVTSNFTSLPLMPHGGACSEPVGLPADLLRAAQSGQVIKIAAVGLGPMLALDTAGFHASSALAARLSSTLGSKITDKQVAALLRASGAERQKSILEMVRSSTRGTAERIKRLRAVARDAAGVDQQGSAAMFGQLASLGSVVSELGGLLPPPGTCAVYPSIINTRSIWPSQPIGLDAGTELLLSGPLGARSLTRTGDGQYQTSFGGGFSTGQLPAGTYSLSAAGGAGVGPFTASLVVANDLHWTNKAATNSVDRVAPLVVTWSSGTGIGYVLFGGSAASPTSGENRTFACVESAARGQLTVPTFVLGALPSTGAASGQLFLAPHVLQNSFSAKGLDAAFFADLNSDNRTAQFR